MSLFDELLKIECPSEIVTLAGRRFKCSGKSCADGGEIFAKAARKKAKRHGYIDCCWLAECVEDPDSGNKLTADQWFQLPRSITGPLTSVVMKLNGIDNEDLERDPKDNGTTETGS